MGRGIGDPGFHQCRATKENVIERRGGISEIGGDRNARAEWNSLPAPAKTFGPQIRDGFFRGETRFVRRRVEIAANDPAERPEFTIRVVHRSDVGEELLHGLFANPDVLVDFSAVALQVNGVNEQELARSELISGEGKPARRHKCARRLPQF